MPFGRVDDPARLDFEAQARALLKGELKRRGTTYRALSEKLEAIGVNETERNLANKISRGGFKASFFLQCMRALSVEELRL